MLTVSGCLIASVVCVLVWYFIVVRGVRGGLLCEQHASRTSSNSMVRLILYLESYTGNTTVADELVRNTSSPLSLVGSPAPDHTFMFHAEVDGWCVLPWKSRPGLFMCAVFGCVLGASCHLTACIWCGMQVCVRHVQQFV